MSFLDRWYDANAPRRSRRGSTNRNFMYGTSHDDSRRVHRENGYGGGVGAYKPQGGSLFSGNGSSFQYNKPPTAPKPPQPPGQGQPPQQGGGQQQGGGGVPYFSNLENNLPLPQGWQRQYAQPTSISSTITSLLYQSRRDPADVWGSLLGGNRTQNQSYGGGTSYGGYQGSSTTDNRGTGASGGSSSSSSSSSGSMMQSTYDALQLADAYFAPKRLELAYQLGDMETDMKRLAVNLGRQVDDPILQAKLYKEAMKGVRTLDSDQNSFALQMVEQRRKEDTQNKQFYDQLNLEMDKMKQQDDQFYASLELQRRQVNLQAQQVNQATGG